MVIFGYTLSGIKFAKSEYGFYDNININKDGNIITMKNKKEFTILSGSDLSKINIDENEEVINSLKDIKSSNWLQTDFFLRGQDENLNEIITFFDKKDGKNKIKSINLIN